MTISRARSIVGDRPEGRPASDFYPTPPEAVEKLLSVECIPTSTIWEPACGDGAICKVLKQHNYDVLATDKYDHGYGISGVDFLEQDEPCDLSIITNPPFRIANDFIRHTCAMINPPYFAFLMKLSALEGVERSAILEITGLTRVWVFRRRLTMTRNGEPSRNGGMIAFAWFVWERWNVEPPRLGWI